MFGRVEFIALAVGALFMFVTFGRCFTNVEPQSSHVAATAQSATLYMPDCTSRNDAELCAQSRTADLAERQARITETSNMLLGIGILFAGTALAILGWAVKTYQNTSQRQLRAYVTMRMVSVADLYGSPVFKVVLQNGGQTPAYKLRCNASIAVVRHPFDGPFTPAARDSTPPTFTMLAGATTTVPVGVAEIWNAANVQELKSGKLAIYIFGNIRYRDVFDVEHTTSFRTMLGGDSGILEDGALAFCSDGNDSS